MTIGLSIPPIAAPNIIVVLPVVVPELKILRRTDATKFTTYLEEKFLQPPPFRIDHEESYSAMIKSTVVMPDPESDEEIVLRLLSPFEAWHTSKSSSESLTFQTPLSLERWPRCDWSPAPPSSQEQSKDGTPLAYHPRSQDSPTQQPPIPNQRLTRMRESFEKNKSVLADDYAYFTTPRESIHPNKAAHKSAERNERRSPEQSEKKSSDNADD